MLRRISQIGTIGGVGVLLTMLLAGVSAAPAAATSSNVLYVGKFHDISTPKAQTFTTIQRAVNAAKPGDWILIAPGDYHEDDDAGITKSSTYTEDGWYGGVVIDTSNIHLRGMNRNTVIVDGTLSPSAGGSDLPCSSSSADQNFLDGLGQNGIVVWKANDVSIDNLTVCNYQAGTGDSGNEIWWNGGDESGKIGLHDYEGSYLTATNTYFENSDASGTQDDHLSYCDTCALYGIFSSNSDGGSWNQLYANNFADSGAYIGACQDVCNAVVDHAWFEEDALGYSGTNSGGSILIEHSKFDNNKEGLDTNTALTGDPPPPQDGECPGNHATKTSVKIPNSVNSCWVFEHNVVTNNNNPNVPIEGTAGLGPTGTGMTISGGRYDVVKDNKFTDNDAWGQLFVPYPDPNLKSDGKTCKSTGGIVVASFDIPGVKCLFDPEGDASLDNTYSGNSSWGNSTNADIGNLLAAGSEPEDCFSHDTDGSGAATEADAAQMSSKCGADTPKSATLTGRDTNGEFLTQAECDAGLFSPSTCTNDDDANYPQATGVVMEPLPGASSLTDPQSTTLPTMPNPCSGVPSNSWCKNGKPR